MSTIRVERVSSNVPRTVMGEVVEQDWTTIAAEREGPDGNLEPDPEKVGLCKRTRRAYFAYFSEALAWQKEQVATGWYAVAEPWPCATAYFGPTDSPSNCWTTEVVKEVLPEEQSDVR